MKPRSSRRMKSADIRVEISEHADAAQAIIDSAKARGGEDLNDAERVQFQAHLSDVDRLKRNLRAAEADETRRLQVATAAMVLKHPAPLANVRDGIHGSQNMNNQITVKHPHLKSYRGANAQRDALISGHFVKAVIARSRGGVDEAREEMLAGHGFDVRAAMTEGDGTKGGYLVPQPMSNGIIDVRADVGVARRTARVHPMSSETENVARHTGATTVYYPGEGGEITASDETFGQIQLTAKKRGILAKLSRELSDDAIIPIVDQLIYDMGHSLAAREDAEYINGDGTSVYGNETGLLASLGAGGVFAPTNSTGKSVWSGLTMQEFTDAMAKLPSKYQSRGPVWITSSEFYHGVMLKVLASAGGNTLQSLADGVAVGMFLGKLVFFSDFMPKTSATSQVSALYGSFGDACLLGDRSGISIAISSERYFETDQIGIKATSRYDINVFDGGDANAAGAYVGLATAAS